MRDNIIRFGEDPIKATMVERIAKVKAEYDARLQAKLEKSEQIEARAILNDEDIEVLRERSELFLGNITDMTKARRHEKLCMAANWLDVNGMEVLNVSVDPVSGEKPYSSVTMDISSVCSFDGVKLKVFTAMCMLADTVFIGNLGDLWTRFCFGVCTVNSEAFADDDDANDDDDLAELDGLMTEDDLSPEEEEELMRELMGDV